MLPISTLQGAAGVCALVALLTSFVALATPAWQVVYAREIQQWVQSGLWLNCQTRPSGMYTCTYTFSESDFQFYTSAELINLRTPPFFAWQRTLLAVFLLGQLFTFLGLASLTLSFVVSTRRLSALLNIVSLSIAALLHVGALVSFAMFSQMVEYRFYHVSVSGIYEKHRGYSFYIEMTAFGLLVVALFLAVAHLVRDHVGRTKYNKSNNRKRHYQQQQIFDEEPYSLQHRNNNINNLSYNNSFSHSDSNILSSNYSDYGGAYTGAKTYSFEQPRFQDGKESLEDEEHGRCPEIVDNDA